MYTYEHIPKYECVHKKKKFKYYTLVFVEYKIYSVQCANWEGEGHSEYVVLKKL